MKELTFSRTEIEELLPHRGHALFLTEARVNGTQVHGKAVWESAHPHLEGHFPELPLVPGVFLIEAAAQLAGVALAIQNTQDKQFLGVLAGVRKALIHRPVHPGNPISFEVKVSPSPVGSFLTASGVGHDSGGNKVVTVELTIGVIERAAFQKAQT